MSIPCTLQVQFPLDERSADGLEIERVLPALPPIGTHFIIGGNLYQAEVVEVTYCEDSLKPHGWDVIVRTTILAEKSEWPRIHQELSAEGWEEI